uniref:SSD domain-containing protein n=1 Tax=Oryza rufipogon TaxID=4529 RepID=A0A0E0PCP0_ORYRU
MALVRRRRGVAGGGGPALAAVAVALMQLVFLVPPTRAQQSNGTSRVVPAEGYCSMYGICAQRSDGKVLNCVNATKAVKPDTLFSARIQSLCPTITGDVCCTVDQFDTLHQQVQQAIPFLVGCPACLRNFLNLFCEMSCSPNQSLFINVTSVKQVNNTMTVNGIDYYVTSTYGEELYNSCKDVKFGTLNTRAMDFLGGGAKNYKEWMAFIGRQADLNQIGSPYLITFPSDISGSTAVKPLNATIYSCGDPSLGCSCGDCPSSSVCTGSLLPQLNTETSCSVKMGSLKAKCLDFSLVVVYLVLLTRRSGIFSHTKPLKNAEDKIHSSNNGKVPDSSAQVSEAASAPVQSAHPSVIQTYMSTFFRKHGTFVAKHPLLVLFVSLLVPTLLCIGLIRFKVEIRPEKLWVSSGSRAADEKQYFDSHLAPFYRIEQLVLATSAFGGSEAPTIVNDNNMKLLFQIQKKIDDLRANYSGSTVSLADICLKPLGTECATQSVLQYFQLDPKKYDDSGIDHAKFCFQHYTTEETCLSTFQSPIDPSTILGGFPGNNFTEASAFVITYPVNNKVETTGQENGKAVAWERAYVNLVKEEILPMVLAHNLTMSFSSESSIQDELNRESTADAITIVVLLGLSGVVLVMLSVLGSMGFFSAIGVKSTLIIMEVGVDNMCILVHAVKRQPDGLDLEERISTALVEVGPSITLASLAEVLAFAVSAINPMPATRVFSMFAALAVLLDFLLQVSAFVALIVLDFRRAQDGRIDCMPCARVKSSVVASDGGNHQGLPLLARYMKNVHAPILGYRAVKFVVIAVFVGFSFASIALSTRLQPGLEQKIVLPRDSYLQDYFDDLATYMKVGPPLYFVIKNFNYSSASEHTNKICSINQCDSNSLLNEIAKQSLSPETSYIAKPAASWLDDFLIWMSPEALHAVNMIKTQAHTCIMDAHPQLNSKRNFHGFLTHFRQVIVLRVAKELILQVWTLTSDYVNSMKAARDFSSKMSKELQGMMAILGIQLNAISIVNLVMSIGIAVEFCVHITHAFMALEIEKAVQGKLYRRWGLLYSGCSEFVWPPFKGDETSRTESTFSFVRVKLTTGEFTQLNISTPDRDTWKSAILKLAEHPCGHPSLLVRSSSAVYSISRGASHFILYLDS